LLKIRLCPNPAKEYVNIGYTLDESGINTPGNNSLSENLHSGSDIKLHDAGNCTLLWHRKKAFLNFDPLLSNKSKILKGKI
jgi:hypothetical protein